MGGWIPDFGLGIIYLTSLSWSYMTSFNDEGGLYEMRSKLQSETDLPPQPIN